MARGPKHARWNFKSSLNDQFLSYLAVLKKKPKLINLMNHVALKMLPYLCFPEWKRVKKKPRLITIGWRSEGHTFH